MRVYIASIIMVITLCLALYLGGYVMFIGGIIDLIDVFKADVTNTSMVAWAIVKLFFSSIVGYGIFYSGIVISALIGTK